MGTITVCDIRILKYISKFRVKVGKIYKRCQFGDKSYQIKTNQVHKFGNLTLTRYNSKLSNMSFDKKKNPLQDGKNIGYMNGLWLNKTLREQESWTAKDIEKRTELLVKKAIQLFSFNSEN